MSFLRWNRWNKLSRRKSAPLRPQTRQLRLGCEPLESRKMLTLLGVAPAFPVIAYDSNGVAQYDAGTTAFNINATPLVFKASLAAFPRAITNPRDVEIHILVDHTGNLIGGTAGDDLVVAGNLDLDGNALTTADNLSGVLLTGEVSGFGFLEVGATDQFDFRFTPTGGALLPFWNGKDIGMTTTSEHSTFNNDFSVNFGGGAKGNIGVIAPLLSSIAGNVYADDNNNGLFETGLGEVGISGVDVTLTGMDVDGLNVNLTQQTDVNGAYLFTGLRPGTYTITETQPTIYLDGQDTQGTPGNGTAGNDVFSNIQLAAGVQGVNNDFGELVPASVSGFVYLDANNDGFIDFGEAAIAGVTITLTGTDIHGNAVNMSTTTDADGMYLFEKLLPGTYVITETQPVEYLDGIDMIGSQGGLTSNDQFSEVVLNAGTSGINNNFGERVESTTVHTGQTATIGFWNNKNGQALIKSLNGGPNATSLSTYLATSFANMYGASAGAENLTGKTNSQVAAYFQQLFKVKGQKLNAQVLAVALATYVTNVNLAGSAAVQYGFEVTVGGVGAATYNVGSSGAAFGVADNTVLTVAEILARTNLRASNGLLWDLDVNSLLSSTETALRNMANEVFDGINNQGDIA